MTYKDFYPTSTKVAEKLTKGLHLIGAKVLEPSAGKGDIVDYLKTQGATVGICEIDPDLYKVAGSKADEVHGCCDFLTLTTDVVSHYDYIVMNPPFSKVEEHIVHAWNIAPAGCEIRFIMPSSRYIKEISRKRTVLKNLIDDHGHIFEKGRLFEDSERHTSVDVMIGRLTKPQKEQKNEFDDYLFEMEDSDISSGEGIMEYNEVREVVNRVIGAIKLYDDVLAKAVQMNDLLRWDDMLDGEVVSRNTLIPRKNSSRDDDLVFTLSQDGVAESRENFKKEIQRGAWINLFSKLNLDKFLTDVVKGKIEKFLDKQQHVPFTMKNVYSVFNIIIQTSGQLMDETYLDVFDRLTSYDKENRYHIEGWKTNSHYMVNKKVIIPDVVNEVGELKFYGRTNASKIDDLYKVLCHMEGVQFDKKQTLHWFLQDTGMSKEELRATRMDIYEKRWPQVQRGLGDRLKVDFKGFVELEINREFESKRHRNYRSRSTWYDWTFFQLKWFKKGTIHLKFKDEDVWRRFNKKICEIRGFELPTNF